MNFLTPLRKIIRRMVMCIKKTESSCRVDQKAGVVGGEGDSFNYSRFFNDMGPITAREIHKRRLDKHIMAEMGINGTRNLGRYQIVRMQEVNGSITHTLLVDKQKQMVVSLCRKDARLSDRRDV